MTKLWRDWDFVAMSDYQADMKEATANAVGAITAMRKRAEQAEQLLAAVVISVGGKAIVSTYDLHRLPKINLEIETCPATRSVLLRARDEQKVGEAK